MPISAKFWIIFGTIATYSALPVRYNVSVFDLLKSLQLTDNNHKIGYFQSDRTGVCKTEACYNLALLYTQSMDGDIDPCSNFYKYACNGWTGIEASIPRSRVQLVRSDFIAAIMENHCRGMLESAPKVTDILPIRQAKKFYQSCMNTDARISRGIKSIALLLASNGGWPMAMNIRDWREYSWQEVDEYFARLGATHAFYDIELKMEASMESENHRNREIVLNAPQGDNFLEFRDNYEKYRSMLKPIVQAFIRENEADVPAEKLEKDIHDLFIFERKLQKARGELSSRNYYRADLPTFFNVWNEFMSILRLTNHPKNTIAWPEILQQLFDGEGVELETTLPISFEDPYYSVLPRVWAATDERTIVNYVHWKFVSQALKYTSTSHSSNLPRSQQCLEETRMAHAEVYWLAQNFFGKDVEEAAQKLSKNVKEELISQMEHSTWLSDDGKAGLKKKLEETKISYRLSDWDRNRTAVEYHYEGLDIDDDYVANILSFRQHQKKYAIRRFIGREQEAGWTSGNDPLQPTIFYQSEQNLIDIGAAYLQPPSFGSKLPNYINYAAAGATIGHELGHAIDQERFERNHFSSILKPDMLDKVQKQLSCVQEHFSKYYRNKTISEGTLSEDVSDLIGLQSSLGAYKNLRQNQVSNEDELPGFDEFTDEQMFFLSFGQAFCGMRLPGSEDSWSDVHSPAEFRVNGGVSNTPDFGKAFNCPVGSPMNPAIKCSIWT